MSSIAPKKTSEMTTVRFVFVNGKSFVAYFIYATISNVYKHFYFV